MLGRYAASTIGLIGTIFAPQPVWAQAQYSGPCAAANELAPGAWIGTQQSHLFIGSSSSEDPWYSGERFWIEFGEPSSGEPQLIQLAVNDEPADEADFPGIVSYTFPTAAEAEIIIFIAGNGPGLPSATVLDVGCQQTGQRPPFQMNLGLNDVWFDDNIPGQGVMITIYPSIHFVFLAIFVFDLERSDPETPFEIGDPGHRWLTAFGNYEDNQADLEIELTSGGVFLDTNILPSQIEDGSMNIEFSDCQNATLHYDIASANLQGTIELTRIANDRVGLCEAMRDPSDD